MELPSKLLEQIAFNTRPKIREHILVFMEKSTHEEHLSQPLQTNNKQFKIAVTFLTGYNGYFNVTNLNNQFYFKKSCNDGEFTPISIPQGAYEVESLNNEIKRIIIDEEHYSKNNYPFSIKPNFSTLRSIVEISQAGPIVSFVWENSIGKLLGFDETILYNEYNLSPNPVDNLSFDNNFLKTDMAQGTIFKSKRSGIIHKFTMDVDPGYNYIENSEVVFNGIWWILKILFQVLFSN